MQARKLIEGSTYGPETMRVIGKAFDAAWATINHHFASDGLASEEARVRLAHAVLAVAHEDSRDCEELKDAALQVMALSSGELDANAARLHGLNGRSFDDERLVTDA
jgi:hypothetical protein